MAEEKKTTKKATTTKKPAAKKTTTKKTSSASTVKKAASVENKEPKKATLDLNAAIKAASKKKEEEKPAKKSLDDIIKHDQEHEPVKSDKPFDHVEVLRKKMEAQKKLNEEIKASEKDNDIKKKLQALTSANLDELEESVEKEKENIKEEISEEYNSQIRDLEDKISKLNEEVKERDEQIAVLTNSIVAKSNETDLLKEIEALKQEISALKENKKEERVEEKEEPNKVDINSSEVQSIIAQGDILLRIKLLNERIAEKDAQIKLVEDELNSLTEKDIFATTFATQIKIIRDDRKDSVVNANKKLVTISKNVKNAEVELNKKVVARDKKKEELDNFDTELAEKKLSYLEKEDQLKVRAKLITEYDSISVKVDEARENFIKQVKIYKKIIKEAELFVEHCNQQESDLIELYLRKLREERSNENKDYNESKKEREDMLQELNKLNSIYEEMKAQNIINDEELPSVEEIDAMKKEYARLLGKLEMIKNRYQERSEVEDVLRTVDPEVSEYLKAFNEKERLEFDLAEKKKLASEEITPEMKARLGEVVVETQDRIDALSKVVAANEDNEKVVFYKQLLGSMAELKEKEVIFKERAEKLKLEIERVDFSDEEA